MKLSSGLVAISTVSALFAVAIYFGGVYQIKLLKNKIESFGNAVSSSQHAGTLYTHQLLEWKNILLSGNSSQSLDRFKQLHNMVQTQISLTQDAFTYAGIDTTEVYKLKQKHAQLLTKIQVALDDLIKNNVNSTNNVNQMTENIINNTMVSFSKLTKNARAEKINKSKNILQQTQLILAAVCSGFMLFILMLVAIIFHKVKISTQPAGKVLKPAFPIEDTLQKISSISQDVQALHAGLKDAINEVLYKKGEPTTSINLPVEFNEIIADIINQANLIAVQVGLNVAKKKNLTDDDTSKAEYIACNITQSAGEMKDLIASLKDVTPKATTINKEDNNKIINNDSASVLLETYADMATDILSELHTLHARISSLNS